MKKLFRGTVETSGADFCNENVGRHGVVTMAIKPPLPGRVMVGDAEWTAEADTGLEAGASVRVVAQRNLTMKVAPAE